MAAMAFFCSDISQSQRALVAEGSMAGSDAERDDCCYGRGTGAVVYIALVGYRGAPGAKGHPSGDLLLEVEFSPHSRFRAQGPNLHLTLPVTPWEAALGAIVPVDVPGSALKVRIPEGTQSGRQLRVRGKGIPSNPPGDLLLDIRVVLPPADTPAARQLYKTMVQDLAFDPRRNGKD
jgi:curved DNA-binding protein